MGKKVKIGVFGGYRGRTMINILQFHPDAELVAVCDRYQPILDAVGKKAEEMGQKVALYTDFDEFFQHDMDAVVLANYATEHGTYAVKFLDSGRHVLSEVLPTETMAQAVALCEAVERSGKVYAYAENYCYMQHAFEMWRRYKAGEIGEAVYLEGEYVHDCASIWPRITYGDRNHWRNLLTPNFYCTHSCGPMIAMSGLRPVQVVGFELPQGIDMLSVGAQKGAAVEMITFENGAVGKSLHGDLKRTPSSYNYVFYGQNGMMESDRFAHGHDTLSVYSEIGKPFGKGVWEERFVPPHFIEPELAAKVKTHGGSDFYPTHFFIRKILGDPIGEEWSIDVYKALDMSICGLLGYRSVLAGNKPMAIPNFRNKEEREPYRNDNACTNPAIAGDQLLPITSWGERHIPDAIYDRCKQLWLEKKDAMTLPDNDIYKQ
ncbi:MAG: Gfo/Idh/MocA family oxidoreductase [Ruminococcaceae bacterium]|nr:Gfo/Idh/MocA family oxidoreductase [Oscillospiraceae bacterium]